MSWRHGLWVLCCMAAVSACGEPGPEPAVTLTHDDQAFSSADATLLDFTFDGELVTSASSGVPAKQRIQDQLLYTIGHLNGNRSVGRIDRLALSNIQVVPQQDGTRKITYHAVLPVAWGSKTRLPTTYDFRLPKDVTFEGLEAFTTKYMEDCVDPSAHDVEAGNMWYYYRPSRTGCPLDAADVVAFTATVTPSTENTTGKYPEYQKVWEDDALRFVAIFGKDKDGATEATDPGIAAFNRFVQAVKKELTPFSLTTTPASVPADPGVAHPDITFEGTLPDGKTVHVHALLVDNVRTPGPAFDQRYEALSTTADVLMYNGHAGLGSNVRALAQKGTFVAGQYVIVFMNGCDTFAYVDGALAQTRAKVNPDDPTGTKYMDIVTNAMPAFFSQLSNSSMALLRALMKPQAPVTYEQMFRNIDRAQIVVVTGEEDNVFTPAPPQSGQVVQEWTGTVARREKDRFASPPLPAGQYVVSLSPTTATSRGDADLYVRVGSEPSATIYDCRPFKSGVAESCDIALHAEAPLHVMVSGFSATAVDYAVKVTRKGAVPPQQ